MKYYLAVFSSITFANKIKKAIEKQRGFATLMHTPSGLKENGCSYCLRFKETLLSDILNISDSFDIKIKSIYEENKEKYIKIK